MGVLNEKRFKNWRCCLLDLFFLDFLNFLDFLPPLCFLCRYSFEPTNPAISCVISKGSLFSNSVKVLYSRIRCATSASIILTLFKLTHNKVSPGIKFGS